jgi:hypothetical protein
MSTTAPGGPVGVGPDPADVAAAARRKDPGLPAETAELLAGQVPGLLAEAADEGAPGLARALLAANPDVGATACNVVATAAVDHLAGQDQQPEQAQP